VVGEHYFHRLDSGLFLPLASAVELSEERKTYSIEDYMHRQKAIMPQPLSMCSKAVALYLHGFLY